MLFLVKLFYLAAGLLVYIFLHNRILSHLRGGITKVLVQIGMLVAILGLLSGLGIWYSLRSAWGAWPAIGILLLAVMGEIRHVLLRRRLRGAPPVEVTPINSGFQRNPTGAEKPLSSLVTTTDLQLACYEVEVPGWTGPVFSVLHISDLHINEYLPAGYYRQALEQVHQHQPDLVFLTGDFITHRRNIPLLSELLSVLPTPQARGEASTPRTFALLGNHDYWAAPQGVAETLRQAGIELLQGSWRRIEIGGMPILVGGDESPWGEKLARSKELVSSLTLILSHTPDNIFRLVRECQPTAVFSGHVHAGQVRFPLSWAAWSFSGKSLTNGNLDAWDSRTTAVIIPSIYGRRFDHGHFIFPLKPMPGHSPSPSQAHLFVTSGVGAGEPSLRVLCPPDLFLVYFKGVTSHVLPDSPTG